MEEKTIVKTAFNIFILFSYLCDMDIKNEVIDLFKYNFDQEND